MSLRVLTWVFHDSDADGSDRLVLLSIADEADDSGYCYPGVNRLAAKSHVHRATVMRCLGSLEAAGELVVNRPKVHARGRHNQYVVAMGRNPLGIAAQLKWPTPRLSDDLAEQWSQAATKGAELSVAQRSQIDAETVAPMRPDPTTPRPARRASTSNDPYESRAAADHVRAERNARRARGEACPDCGDTGLVLDDDTNVARPCPRAHAQGA